MGIALVLGRMKSDDLMVGLFLSKNDESVKWINHF